MGLNVADWIAIAIVLLAAVGGFRRGLVLSAFSLIGLGVGAYLGSRLAPHVLNGGSSSTWTPFAALVGAVVGALLLQFAALVVGSFIRGGMRITALRLIDSAGGLLLGGAIGLAPHVLNGGSSSTWTPFAALVGAVVGALLLQFAALVVGSFIRGGMRITALRLIDSAGGLLLGGAIGLAIVWVGASVALLTPGQTSFRHEVERSEIVRQLNSALPPRTLLNLLARIDPLTSIVGPKAPSLPPSKGVLRDPSIQAATTRIVKVLGTACGVGVEGSGWIAGRNLIVTAAHVVAGENNTIVRIPGQPLSPVADVVVLDIHNDVAVLRVPELDLKPLRLADPRPGAPVAILGYPLDAGLTATPGRIGRTATVLTQDAFERGPVARTITAVAGRVEHGNSGGPAIDRAGRVESMIFAQRKNSPSGFGVPPSIIRSDLARAGTERVPNNDCAP